MYEQGYHRFLTKRDSCIVCEFCGYQRQGDLTIGDFWGIEQHDERLTDGKGTSLLYVNNEVGRRAFESVRSQFKVVEQTPLEASRFNSIIKKRTPHPMRERFFGMYPDVSFVKSVDQCMKDYHDVIVLGNITGENYGSHITHYALYSALRVMGYTVGMLNVPQDSRIKASDIPRLFSESPYRPGDLLPRYRSKAAMRELNDRCGAFVTGSDQQFATLLYNNDGEFVTQPFADASKRKVAYAASLGRDSVDSDERERATMGFFLQRFDAVSVREDTAIALFQRHFGVSASHVLDPVFLMPRSDYARLLHRAEPGLDGRKYLFTYMLDATPEKEDMVRQLASRHGLEVLAISDASDDGTPASFATAYRPTLETWLAHFAHAEFVVTDSFHGTCLSLIFGRQFLSLVNRERGATRFESLFRLLSLEDRAVYSKEDFEMRLAADGAVDYQRVNALLDHERERSRQWLKAAVDGSGDLRALDAYDILDRRLNELEARLGELVSREFESTSLIAMGMTGARPTGLGDETQRSLDRLVDTAEGIRGGRGLYDAGGLLPSIESIHVYLKALRRCSDRYYVFFAVRDTPGFCLDETIVAGMASLGCRANLHNKHWCAYVAAVHRGRALFEELSAPDARAEREFSLADVDGVVRSMSYNAGNEANVILNGSDYAVNGRGLNLVVWDVWNRRVADSVAFDTHDPSLPALREHQVTVDNMPGD